MIKELGPGFRLTLIFTLLTGLLYPAAITALSELVFPKQANGSMVTVDGKVFDVATGLGLSGWSVDLSGSVSATALTDGNGNYSFTVPAGTYTVCEGMPLPGWTNTFPPNGPTCPFGLGYGPFILLAGQSASLNNFGNTHP